jgi:hypothetical protein
MWVELMNLHYFLKTGVKIVIFMCELFDKTEANEHDVLVFYFEFFLTPCIV